jgi:hypothetical protein
LRKKTGEQSLFRQIWDKPRKGDIILGDRPFDAYRNIAQLKARGSDSFWFQLGNL